MSGRKDERKGERGHAHGVREIRPLTEAEKRYLRESREDTICLVVTVATIVVPMVVMAVVWAARRWL